MHWLLNCTSCYLSNRPFLLFDISMKIFELKTCIEYFWYKKILLKYNNAFVNYLLNYTKQVEEF